MPAKVVLAHVPYVHLGGEDRHVEFLQRVYAQLGYECIFAPEDRQAPGLDVRQAIRSLTPDWRSNPHCQRLEQLWQGGAISHVHLHNLFPALGPAFLRWVIERKVPLLMTVHNHRFFCANGLALRDGQVCKECFSGSVAWRPALYRCNDTRSKSAYYSVAITETRRGGLLQRAVGRFIAPSPYIASELTRFGMASDKVVFQVNPIELGLSAKDEVREPLDFFYAGRLSEEKGIAQLIDAAEKLSGRVFGIAGDGPLKGWLEQSVVPRLPNVRYLGALSASQVYTQIRASQVCVLPSICNEILPTFVLESFLSGKKCVVPKRESTLWLAAEPFWGLAAEPTEVGELCRVLEIAWSSPGPTLAQRQNISRQFELKTYGDGLREIIRGLVPQNASL